MKIEIIDYDPRWPDAFAIERTALAAALAGMPVRIEHIGSTAVPGLAAKPIIDMLLDVQDLAELDNRQAQLTSLGYEAMGEFGIAGRRYFRKGGWNRTHQLHAFQHGSPHLLRHRAFRDYLRTHPDVRLAYADLKRGLAARVGNDIDAYGDGKDAFVKHHEALAVAWQMQHGDGG